MNKTRLLSSHKARVITIQAGFRRIKLEGSKATLQSPCAIVWL